MKSNRYRTLDKEWLLETIQEEELRMRSKRRNKKQKHNFKQRFYVILAIIVMAFFSFIAPIMN